MVICDRELGNTDFTKLILELKKAPSAQATGFRKNQGEKIFQNRETHFQNDLLKMNDYKIPAIFAGLQKHSKN
jgi:hypothetical protein